MRISRSASTATATAAAWSTTQGEEIFADKIGVLLARDMSSTHPERQIRRRCEIHRPLRDRSGAKAQRRHDRLLEHRPFLYQAPHQRSARSPGSRSAATSSSIRRSAAAMTTASSPASRCWRCSTAPGQEDVGSDGACPRPGARRPWRPIAPTTRNTPSSRRS